MKDDLDQKLEQLNRELVKAREKRNELQTKLTAQQGKLAELHSERSALCTRLANGEGISLDKIDREIRQAEAFIQGFTSVLADIQGQVDALEGDITPLEQIRSDREIQRQLATLQYNLRLAESAVRDAETTLAEKQKAYDKAWTALNNYRIAIDPAREATRLKTGKIA